MTFTYNDVDYNLPDSLADIQLSTHTEWSLEWGANIAARNKEIEAETDPELRKMLDQIHGFEYYTAAFSFYTGIDIQEVRKNIHIGQIASLISLSQIAWAIDDYSLPVEGTYTWSAAAWQLYSPLEDITIGEVTQEQFERGIRMAKLLAELAKSDWSNFAILTAAYLRHPGEGLTEELIDPVGGRVTLMKTLPMSIGLQVAQYLVNHLVEFTTLLRSFLSIELEPSPPEP